jgi:Wiskott-Aldrich syndrome protein
MTNLWSGNRTVTTTVNRPTTSAAPLQPAAGPSFPSGGEKSKPKKKRLDKSAIGAPTDFRHLTHIGWNPETGFSVSLMPRKCFCVGMQY